MASIRKPKNALKFSRPASWWGSTWREALPTGNGIVGASVYGGAASEVILLNHGDLWWQGYAGVLQDVADKIKDVRKNIDSDAPLKAQDILSKALITKNYRPQLHYPLPLCDFKVKMPVVKGIKEYSRSINMENGEVSVSFKDGSTKYDRSVFVSRSNGLICYEINKVGSKNITANFSFDLHDKFNILTPSSISKLPEAVTTKYENYFMYFSARSDSRLDFGAVAHIKHFGGTQTVDPDNGITIKEAEKILVIIKLYVESQREKEWKNIKAALSANKLTYDKMLKEHAAIHARLFSSADVDFGGTERDAFVEDLISDTYKSGEVSSTLLEKLWAFGRHLFISGANAESQPISPYGIWCGDYKAEDSQINAFGSLQTMYAQALSGNLSDQLLAMFSYYENVIDDLKKNSSRLYGCRGLMIPAIIARGTGNFGSIAPEVTNYTAATAWICRFFYDYYLYTGDVKFLKTRAMPFMKDAAAFYEEFFKVVGDTYESSPSYSPFTSPLHKSARNEKLQIARNSTIDFAACRELLTNLIDGSKETGLYKDEIEKWQDMLTRIPAYKINADGTVSEFIDNDYLDDYTSGSTAMFYPVYPSSEVKISDFEAIKPFITTAKKRFASSTSGLTSAALANYSAVFARLGDGNESLGAISDAIRGNAMGNLIFTKDDWRGMGSSSGNNWAPFSLEANLGVTAAIQEMLVQSAGNTVSILPALPTSMKASGSATGLQAKGGIEIELSWDYRKGIVTAKLKAKKTATVNIKLPAGTKRFKSGTINSFNSETATVEGFTLPGGKIITIEIRI